MSKSKGSTVAGDKQASDEKKSSKASKGSKADFGFKEGDRVSYRENGDLGTVVAVLTGKKNPKKPDPSIQVKWDIAEEDGTDTELFSPDQLEKSEGDFATKDATEKEEEKE